MNLGDLITALEAADPNQQVANGFGNPHSYRGDYYDLAFEPVTDTTVGDMLADARSAVGATYQGWKGGDFRMNKYTWCWLSVEGDASGESVSPQMLAWMLVVPPAAAPSADRAAVLHEAIRRVEDPAERSQTTTGIGLGWEAARDVLRRMAAEVPATNPDELADSDDPICGDVNDDEVCEKEPGHNGDHLNGYATVGWPKQPETAPEPGKSFCPFGEGKADGSGCLKPAGHDGPHIVTPGVTEDGQR